MKTADFLAGGDDYQATRGAGDTLLENFFDAVVKEERNNTLTKLVGHLASRQVGIEAATFFAEKWNDEFCDPPLPLHEVSGVLMSYRKWEIEAFRQQAEEAERLSEKAQQSKAEAELEDVDPDARVLLTLDELLDLSTAGKAGVPWLIPNVLQAGGIHYLSAPAAVGKSWLLPDMGRAVAEGSEWLGVGGITQGAVLYIDEELGEGPFASRVTRLKFPRGLPFHYSGNQGVNISRPDDRDWITEQVKRLDIKLLVLDTLTGLFPGFQENSAEQVSRLRGWFKPWQKLGAAVMVAHHDRKGGEGEGSKAAHERMGGSRDIAAMADMAYGLEAKGKIIHLETTKSRHVGHDDKLDVCLTLEDQDDGSIKIVVMTSSEAKAKTDSEEVRKCQEKIIAALMQGEETAANLPKASGVNRNLCGGILVGLVSSGRVSKRIHEGTTFYSAVTDNFGE